MEYLNNRFHDSNLNIIREEMSGQNTRQYSQVHLPLNSYQYNVKAIQSISQK